MMRLCSLDEEMPRSPDSTERRLGTCELHQDNHVCNGNAEREADEAGRPVWQRRILSDDAVDSGLFFQPHGPNQSSPLYIKDGDRVGVVALCLCESRLRIQHLCGGCHLLLITLRTDPEVLLC